MSVYTFVPYIHDLSSMSYADIALKYLTTYIIYVAAWFLWGHHGEVYSGVYIYYARM